jgi:hypothetical protein
MFNKLVLLFAVVAIFTVAPTFAAPTGCNKIKFQGTYTRAAVNQDVLGDQTVFHSWVFQLEIRADGTAALNSSAYYDFMINTGTNSPGIGNWTCRADGKLVVTTLAALVFPIGPTQIHNCRVRIFRWSNTSERRTCFRWMTPTR